MTHASCCRAVKCGHPPLGLSPAAPVLRIGQSPTLAGSQIRRLIRVSPVVAAWTVLRNEDEAHADRVARPRLLDRRFRIVAPLVTAVIKIDGATRSGDRLPGLPIFQSRLDILDQR